ncbi:hypothetical protein C8R44DRAFT_729842 [Mycena epipterygia]|nr:hypothetical protein C8R44DRAFT_729842 [Mycena epipterygia]
MSDFTTGVKKEIGSNFGGRCALCICLAPLHHTRPILDKAQGAGGTLTRVAIRFNLVAFDFDRSKAYNGLLSSFGPVAFVPCPEVCQYLARIFSEPNCQNRHVDQILAELRYDPTRDPKAHALLDHYILYPSDSWRSESNPRYIATAHFPDSVYYDAHLNSLLPPSAGHPPADTYHIFDATSIPITTSAQTLGVIPLAPVNELNKHIDLSKLYWRLPSCSAGAFIGAVFQDVLVFSSDFPDLETLVLLLHSRVIPRTNTSLISVGADRTSGIPEEKMADRRDLSSPPASPPFPLSPVLVASGAVREYIAREPTADGGRREYTIDEENKWAFGPSWTATEVITRRTGVIHPEPWHQFGDPKDALLVFPSSARRLLDERD